MEEQTVNSMRENLGGKRNARFLGAALFFLLVALIGLISVSAYAKFLQTKYIGLPGQQPRTISVSGSGEIYVKPDLAVINFSVINESETVENALEENSQKMNAIIEAIKSKGVESKDLKTTNFNIRPRYEYRRENTLLYPPIEGERVLAGYEINQTLMVKIRELEKIGEIIQAGTDKGANQVGSLQLTIDDLEAVKEQARNEAIIKAKAKAEDLAMRLGVKLGKLSDFNDSGAFPISSRYYDAVALEASPGIGGAPEIETGENRIMVKVLLTYEIE